MDAPLDDVFVGRDAELARIADVVARMAQGQPWLVSIEGQSGIGKSALAAKAVAPLAGSTVLWARGHPGEADLPYGLIEQLLRGVDRALVGRHPVVAAGLPVASPFAVGADLLSVVGQVQKRGPVVMLLDDVQWADGRSVEALSFMFRRLSVDPVLAIVVVRGDREHLNEPARQMLLSVTRRLNIRLTGLRLEDLAALATAIGLSSLDSVSARRVLERTGGHTLYVRTLLSDRDIVTNPGSEAMMLPRSLAAAISDQLAVLPVDTRGMLEMLAVVNARLPLAVLGGAAQVSSASAAIEPAVLAGLVEWWPLEATCPVEIRHALQRDAIYAGLTPRRRRELHSRAVAFVDDREAWEHRVAALDRPEEELAEELEQLAGQEEAVDRLAAAARYLLWAADISPARVDRERRLLTAAHHLMLVWEVRGMELRAAAEAAAPSPLRSCVLGTMALFSGQFADAELHLRQALAEAGRDPANQPLAATIALRLAGMYVLLGEGHRVITFGRRALESGYLNPTAESRARTVVAVGTCQIDGPAGALIELNQLKPDPAHVEAAHVDGLTYRGVFHLVAGDLPRAVADLSASLKMVRRGVPIILGARAYGYLALAHYLSGDWDEALMAAGQGLSAATIHPRQYELPILHLAATCVPAGRGATEEAGDHARRADQAARDLDYPHERIYGGMARALVCQAAGDYQGMASALDGWLDTRTLDDRSRMYDVLWRPLLVEALIGSSRHLEAGGALRQLASRATSVAFLRPALIWLEGWLAEEEGRPEAADRIYQQGQEATRGDSPLYRARLLFAHGRLLRRTGRRRPAIARLREADELFRAFQAGPFIRQTEVELAGCGLSAGPVRGGSALELTNRESEVAHLVDQGKTNNEIAAELFITPKAVEYHLGNIYAKLGVNGRRQLRRFLDEARRPAPV